MRANAAELKRRVGMVRRLLAAGIGHEEIRAIGAEAWGLGRAQMWRYIQRVYADWQSLAEEESPYLRDLAVEQRNEIFRRALKAGRLRVALQALDRRDLILGLFRPPGRTRPSEERRLVEWIRESLEGEKSEDRSQESEDRRGRVEGGRVEERSEW